MKLKVNKSNHRKSYRINDGLFSCRFPNDHTEILEAATKMTGRDKRALIRRCFEMALAVATPHIVEARLAAAEKAESIKDAILNIPRTPLSAGLMPTAVGLEKEQREAIIAAAESGNVTQTDILVAAIETALPDVVKAILVEQFLARDKATVEAIGRQAAHMSRNDSSGLKGGKRPAAAANGIAAHSRRSKSSLQSVGNKR
jgi:predicted DNA-binding protein